MASKKSQVTAFILLGAVIFTVFSTMLYLSGTVTKIKLESQINDITAYIRTWDKNAKSRLEPWLMKTGK